MYPALKRAVDIAVSAAALLLLLPLLLLIAAAICLDSAGPPIFAHQRIGLRARPFTMVKFRSMVKDAAAQGPYWTAQDDARITRVGKFLRLTSLDELPQLWNVLIGDMSLVGPRPETPQQQSLYPPDAWEQRHRVRPGITGLAQVSGRSQQGSAERLQCDLTYAAKPTLLGDLTIILKTIGLVLRREGTN